MHNLCSSVLSCSPFFFGAISSDIDTQSQASKEVIVYQGPTMSVIVPEQPLAPGAVKIVPNSAASRYADWTKANQSESFELLQKVAQIWQKQGINDYMIYGKDSDDSSFNWEIVPYQENGLTLWKQFKVLYHLTFGAPTMALDDRLQVENNLNNPSADLKDVSHKVSALSTKYDAFCNPEVIKKQLIFEGKYINVLYNYAPIAIDDNKLHFLFVPKEHHERFSELTSEEYLEASALEQSLVRYYKDKGYQTAYLFNKTGAEAGQTVPHWHQHLIFTATKTQDLYGRLIVLKNMILGSSPLPKAELQDRVNSLKDDLIPVLTSSRDV